MSVGHAYDLAEFFARSGLLPERERTQFEWEYITMSESIAGATMRGAATLIASQAATIATLQAQITGAAGTTVLSPEDTADEAALTTAITSNGGTIPAVATNT
jgi:hypothetical protein